LQTTSNNDDTAYSARHNVSTTTETIYTEDYFILVDGEDRDFIFYWEEFLSFIAVGFFLFIVFTFPYLLARAGSRLSGYSAGRMATGRTGRGAG